ncbi:MAG: IS21-like element helper ATPase IstB [Nitrospirae bacterium YQR-1]
MGQIEGKLRALMLTGMLQTLEIRHKQAQSNNSGYMDFLLSLLEDEHEKRQNRSLLKRLREASFEEEKTLEGFDFSFNPEIPAKRIRELSNCVYMERKENVFLLGPVGVGKTHIAHTLGHIACRLGYSVLFTKAPNMFRFLYGAKANNSWANRIKTYMSVQLLIVDDFGLKPLSETNSDDFYEIMNSRYLKRSTIFTSSRAIEDWQGLFPDPIIANAVMDRIAHNAHQIIITGESYRNKGIISEKKEVRDTHK